MTLQDLLSMEIKDISPVTGKSITYSPDFRVAVQAKTAAGIHIIIHAMGHDSGTLDFLVKENKLIPR